MPRGLGSISIERHEHRHEQAHDPRDEDQDPITSKRVRRSINPTTSDVM